MTLKCASLSALLLVIGSGTLQAAFVGHGFVDPGPIGFSAVPGSAITQGGTSISDPTILEISFGQKHLEWVPVASIFLHPSRLEFDQNLTVVSAGNVLLDFFPLDMDGNVLPTTTSANQITMSFDGPQALDFVSAGGVLPFDPIQVHGIRYVFREPNLPVGGNLTGGSMAFNFGTPGLVGLWTSQIPEPSACTIWSILGLVGIATRRRRRAG